MKDVQDTTFNLTIKGTKFSFPKKEHRRLSNSCYKNEKLRKAEEWKIVDSNYNNQDFTHLFTFNIMPIEAMRQSLQDIYAMCRKSRTAGCKEHATFLKCDKIFVRFVSKTRDFKSKIIFRTRSTLECLFLILQQVCKL